MSIVLGKASFGRHFAATVVNVTGGADIAVDVEAVEQDVTVETPELAVAVETPEISVAIEPLNV
jgi:hypothetical protein